VQLKDFHHWQPHLSPQTSPTKIVRPNANLFFSATCTQTSCPSVVHPQYSAAHLVARYLEPLNLRSRHQEALTRMVENKKRKSENGVGGDIP
jgi:hypothetical protein